MTEPAPAQREDPRFAANIAAYRRAARWSLVMLAVVIGTGAAVGAKIAGADGAWSAVLGASVAAVFTLSTQVAAWRGATNGPMAFVTAVAATSVAKFLIVAVVAIVALHLDWVVRPIFGVVLLTGALLGLAIDLVAIRNARIPYVVPDSGRRTDEVG